MTKKNCVFVVWLDSWLIPDFLENCSVLTPICWPKNGAQFEIPHFCLKWWSGEFQTEQKRVQVIVFHGSGWFSLFYVLQSHWALHVNVYTSSGTKLQIIFRGFCWHLTYPDHKPLYSHVQAALCLHILQVDLLGGRLQQRHSLFLQLFIKRETIAIIDLVFGVFFA